MAESRPEFRQPAREGSHPQLPDPGKEVDPLPKMVSSQCQTPFSILLEMTRIRGTVLQKEKSVWQLQICNVLI